MKTVAVSGYFDPIHVGHLEYLEMVNQLGDRLVVIVNNNHQCVLKKGKPFMDEADRVKIVEALKIVDEVFLSIDRDKSVCDSLDAIKPDIFANGGARLQHRSHTQNPEGFGHCRKHAGYLVLRQWPYVYDPPARWLFFTPWR